MYFITNLINSITSPIRSIFYWITQYTPGLKNLPAVSLPMRTALMMFLFLLVVYLAAIASYLASLWNYGGVDTGERYVLEFVGLFTLVIVIPVIVFYLVKFWMIKETSRYPEIDRVWELAVAECQRQGISMNEVPIFLVQGARDHRQASQLIKASQLPFTVTVPAQEETDIVLFANSEVIYLFTNGCSCLSRLSSAPTGPLPHAAGTSGAMGGRSAPTGTIDASMFGAGGGEGVGRGGGAGFSPAPVNMGQTLTDGAFMAPGPAPTPTSMQPAAAGVGGTMLLPEGQALGDLLAASRGAGPADVARPPQLSSQDMVEREQKLRHVCGLLNKARQPLCPVNGLMTILPFELIESAGPQIQVAAQKDLGVLREELLVRCSNTLLITQLDKDDGFQELVKRVGEERSREFRFGKGSELWNAPEGSRLDATAAHAVGAFEDWIYMLFQEENALKHRYNSRLFMLLCRIRGRFADNLRAVLARGFGFDPLTEPHLAHEQFLFGGCYFAATGADPSRQAFVKSVFLKGLQQEGELEWAPEARRRDRQLQLAANLFALLGMVSLLAIVGMLIWKFGFVAGS